MTTSEKVSKLACGIDINSCNGDVDSTAAALDEVISWEALLKKHQPQKHLKRPPVRFLFDLVKHIAERYTSFFPDSLYYISYI